MSHVSATSSERLNARALVELTQGAQGGLHAFHAWRLVFGGRPRAKGAQRGEERSEDSKGSRVFEAEESVSRQFFL